MATEQGRGPIYNPNYGRKLTDLAEVLTGPSLDAQMYTVENGVSLRTSVGALLALPLFRAAYFYLSREDAATGVNYLLPATMAIFTLEGDRLVVRMRNAVDDDPLTGDGWGVVYRSVSSAEVAAISDLVQQAIDAAAAAEQAALLASSVLPYGSRSIAEAASVPEQVQRISVMTDAGSLAYVSDPQGTALTTADGRTWSPDGDATFAHWNVQRGVDQNALIQSVMQWCADRSMLLKVDAGPYYLTTSEVRTSGAIKWHLDGTVFWDVRTSAVANNKAILFAPLFRNNSQSYTVTQKVFAGTREVTLSSVAGLQVGDLFMLQSSLLVATDHRGNARVGQQCKIDAINGNVVTIVDPAEMDYDVWSYEGSVVSAGTSSVTLPSGIDRPTDTMRVRMVMTSGALNGQTRNITGWNNTTKVATFGNGSGTSPWPAGMANGDTFRLECTVGVLACTSTTAEITGKGWLMRDKHLGAVAEATGYIGLDIAYIDSARVSGLNISNMSENCLSLRGCYKGLFEDMTLSGANRSYGVSDGTGYGIAESQTYRCKAQNIRTFECRRGMDTGGSQASSWHFWLDNCEVIGGGVTYTDDLFFPNGPRYNSGMGSHGNGSFMRMTNCRMIDVMNPINLRGRRNEVIDVSAHGFCQQPILMSSIDGALIRGFRYDAGTSVVDVRNGMTQLSAADATKLPPAMIDILTDNINPNGEIIIDGISANPLFGPVVRLSRTGTAPPIYIDGVKAHFSSVTSAPSRFTLVDMLDGSGTPTISDLHVVSAPVLTGRDGPDVIASGASVTTSLYNTAIPVSGTVYRKWDNSMNFVLANNTAKAIYIGTMDNPLEVSVFDNTGGASVFAQGVIMNARSQADASPNNATNKASIISLRNIELTGSSGTVGQVSLSYGGGNKPYFYIENRSGATKRLTLQLRQFGLVT